MKELPDNPSWLLKSFDNVLEPSDVPSILATLKNKKRENSLRMNAAAVIGEMEMLPVSGIPVIGSSKNVSDQIIRTFKKILKDKTEGYRLRLLVLDSLKKQIVIISIVAPFLGPKDIDIIGTLKQISLDEDDNSYVRKYAREVLQSWYTYWQRAFEAHKKRKIELTNSDKKVKKEVERVLKISHEAVLPKILFGMGIGSNVSVFKALDVLEQEGKMKRVRWGLYKWTGD